MRNIILVLGISLLTFGFIGCTASISTGTNNANKPANTNTAANTTTNSAANTSSASNSASNTAAAPATSGADQDFTLVNKTGVIIDKLFVSPSDKDDWQEDILGQDQLADGATLNIKFHPKEKAEMWDLKIEDTKGNSIEWTDLKLTEIEKITLHYKDGKGTAETE
ncbi:MAG: hypothetical protein ACKVQJ_02335 [Pyrinomonadaceae bacterium]